LDVIVPVRVVPLNAKTTTVHATWCRVSSRHAPTPGALLRPSIRIEPPSLLKTYSVSNGGTEEPSGFIAYTVACQAPTTLLSASAARACAPVLASADAAAATHSKATDDTTTSRVLPKLKTRFETNATFIAISLPATCSFISASLMGCLEGVTNGVTVVTAYVAARRRGQIRQSIGARGSGA
jgi:hypothetical protein